MMNTYSLKTTAHLSKCIMFLITIFLSGCNQQSNDIININGATMGTTFSVQIVNNKLNSNKKTLEEKITDILVGVNKKMSTWDSASEISKINNMPVGHWVPVSSDSIFIYSLANAVSKKTNGAFDITTGNLIELWGFTTNDINNVIPSENEIKQAILNVGYEKLLINEMKSAVYKKYPFKLDLSAIAKGYAVDKIAEYLNKNKISAYLVEVGGEIRVKGKKRDEKKWKVAIETPLIQDRKAIKVINITDHAIATSGDYRNYYEIAGQRYSHTIDPFTGKPITHNLSSVTVISNTSAYADAIATALMVMGVDKGIKFCEKNGIPAYFIYKQDNKFKVSMTRNFKKFLQ